MVPAVRPAKHNHNKREVYDMSCKNFICSMLFVSVPLVPVLSLAESHTVSIEAGADNTLYEDSISVSNGSGTFMLAGRLSRQQYNIRRALVYFDVAGILPHNAIVEEVSVTLYLERGNGGVREMRLHRLNADWGEGDSRVGGGGDGAPAAMGDATWQHTFYPDSFWGSDGGRYVGRVSASHLVGNPGGDEDNPSDIAGPYTWESTDRLVDDVRRWLHNPVKNYGWILVGDESVPSTAKRFSSKETTMPGQQPMLEVTYSLPE
jgi:hypothetical protein